VTPQVRALFPDRSFLFVISALLSIRIAHFREDFVKIAQPFIRFLGEAVD
jgi:hypothetical protein